MCRLAPEEVPEAAREGRGRDQAAGAVVALAVPGLAQARDLYVGAAVGRLDEAAAADVHPDVCDAVEEHEVARAQAPAGDAATEVEVGVAAVRKRNAEAGVDEANEAGAIEAGGESPPQT